MRTLLVLIFLMFAITTTAQNLTKTEECELFRAFIEGFDNNKSIKDHKIILIKGTLTDESKPKKLLCNFLNEEIRMDDKCDSVLSFQTKQISYHRFFNKNIKIIGSTKKFDSLAGAYYLAENGESFPDINYDSSKIPQKVNFLPISLSIPVYWAKYAVICQEISDTKTYILFMFDGKKWNKVKYLYDPF